MRFLLINRFFGGQQTPTGRMLQDVAKELRRQRHDVTILTSKAKYAGESVACNRADSEFMILQFREFGGGRGPRWISFWLRALCSLASRRWDRCVLLTDPPFLPFAAWLTAIFRTPRQRVYWWTMDIYPEALVAANMVREQGFIYRSLRWLNDCALCRISGVIALGRRQLQRLQSYPRWNPASGFSAVVPPWDVRPMARIEPGANRVLNRLGWQGKRIALYTGNLGEGHLFAPFLDAATWFHRQQRTDWIFVFVVRGSGRGELAAQGTNLPNVSIMDYFPEHESAELLWSATVHLVSMKPGWEGIIVPSKVYGAFQTRSPLLFVGPLDSDTAAEVQALGRGRSLPPTATGEAIGSALDDLAGLGWIREPHGDAEAPRRVAEFVMA